MEKIHGSSWRGLLPQAVLLVVLYYGIYGISHLLDPMAAKGLVVSNILIFTPLFIFLSSTVYAWRHGFSLLQLAMVVLLYPLTILTFGEWIWLYHLAYTFCSLVGNLVGAGLFSLRNKSAKNP